MFLCLLSPLMSCTNTENEDNLEDVTATSFVQAPLEPIEEEPASEPLNEHQKEATAFVNSLEQGKTVAEFFANNWTLLYHEDNRCDGTTAGEIDNLSKSAVDNEILIQVENNGDGWACETQDPSAFILHFELSKKVTQWDRFEIQPNQSETEAEIYIMGAGESDYLILYYNMNHLIKKLEYRSEDPG